jgi:dolichol-phosphate mannosyltransferase
MSWRINRDTVVYLLEHVFALLEDGGRAILIEANPWNPMLAARRAANRLLGRRDIQALLSRIQLYELLSEIGFIRVSARFTDFVYRPRQLREWRG